MAECELQTKEHTYEEDSKTYRVTTLVKVQKKRVLTNPDIEERKKLVKFGRVQGKPKGDFDNFISVEEKDIYLINPKKAMNDETIGKFNSMHHSKVTKLEKLEQQQSRLREGELEDTKHREVVEYQDSYSVKVSNLPEDIDENELSILFSRAGRVGKIFIPRAREPQQPPRRQQGRFPIQQMPQPRDYAFIHFNSKEEVERAIRMLNNSNIGKKILQVEQATRRVRKRPV